MHDALTGLPDRRHLSEAFRDQLQKQHDPGHSVVVLRMDSIVSSRSMIFTATRSETLYS